MTFGTVDSSRCLCRWWWWWMVVDLHIFTSNHYHLEVLVVSKLHLTQIPQSEFYGPLGGGGGGGTSPVSGSSGGGGGGGGAVYYRPMVYQQELIQ